MWEGGSGEHILFLPLILLQNEFFLQFFFISGLTAGVRRPSDTRDVYLNQNISQLKR
jgi:hypothetical protein